MKSEQLTFDIKSHGGRRAGSGRKNRSGELAHVRREQVSLRTPLHITFKLVRDLPSLRSPAIFTALKIYAARVRDFGVNVVHFSVQSNHIHMIVEVLNNQSLGRAMRSLAGRLGKMIRDLVKRGSAGLPIGKVFFGRYHMRVIRSPLQMRNALRYVLLNFSQHEELIDHLDQYSTASSFTEWRSLLRERYGALIEDQVESLIIPGQREFGEAWSWLCKVGWMRAKA